MFNKASSVFVRIMAVFTVLSFLVFSVVINSKNLSKSFNVYACHNANGQDSVGCATIVPSATPDLGTPAPTDIPTPTNTPRGVQRIRICESTDSQTNPYVNITVDQDSADGQTGNDNGQGDHYLTHNGPVWTPGSSNHSWGDIIPPIPANGANPGHSGRNWHAEGQAIWNNNCNVVIAAATPTPTPFATATPGTADICANIDGIQTSVPADLHLDASGLNCVAFQLGGPPSDSGTGGGGQVLGTSTVAKGRVLGTSTMAKTGGVDILSLVFSIGALTLGIGIRKYSYATSKK